MIVLFRLAQEMRAKLQADDPEMGFGDLGRRLGEMWHSLTEDEKEDYRYHLVQAFCVEQRTRKRTTGTTWFRHFVWHRG
jgi:hypothetical protein